MNRRAWFSVVFVIIIAVLTISGIILLMKTDKEGNARVQEPVRRVVVQLQELTPRSFTKAVEVYATVSAVRRGSVSAQVTGPIAQIAPNVDPGDPVTKDQELARIEDLRLTIALQKAKAALEKSRALLSIEQNQNKRRTALFSSAQQRLELAESDYKRKKTLWEKELISKQALELAESQVELQRSEFERARSELQSRDAFVQSIRADIAAAEAEIRRIEEDLADTVIRAPFDGVIGDRMIELGDQVSPGQPVFTVLDISTVKVLAQVPSEYVGRIRPGISAEVLTRAYQNLTFEGQVAQVHPEADRENRTFSVEIHVNNQQNELLLPGMFARVRIPVLNRSQAVTVPRAAILEDEKGSYVYVADLSSQAAQRRDVVVGDFGSEEALINEGLRPGERIIIRGQELLHDGASIQWESTAASEASAPASE